MSRRSRQPRSELGQLKGREQVSYVALEGRGRARTNEDDQGVVADALDEEVVLRLLECQRGTLAVNVQSRLARP